MKVSEDLTEKVRVTEIFYSLQGEAVNSGIPTTFIRLTGCPLRCSYCDTDYAFSGGEWMTLDQVLQTVQQYDARYVTVTGGEPLAQKNALPLMSALCDMGYQVSLETSGALDISEVDERVVRVMDIKTPSSGECDKNNYDNINFLRRNDQVKFVISDREDYEWSQQVLEQYHLPELCEVLFSPVWGTDSTAVADWILGDHLPVRFQLQLHKLLWGEARGH